MYATHRPVCTTKCPAEGRPHSAALVQKTPPAAQYSHRRVSRCCSTTRLKFQDIKCRIANDDNPRSAVLSSVLQENSLSISTQHSLSRDANGFSDSQEIPHNLWKPKVRHRVNRKPPQVPVPSEMNAVPYCKEIKVIIRNCSFSFGTYCTVSSLRVCS